MLLPAHPWCRHLPQQKAPVNRFYRRHREDKDDRRRCDSGRDGYKWEVCDSEGAAGGPSQVRKAGLAFAQKLRVHLAVNDHPRARLALSLRSHCPWRLSKGRSSSPQRSPFCSGEEKKRVQEGLVEGRRGEGICSGRLLRQQPASSSSSWSEDCCRRWGERNGSVRLAGRLRSPLTAAPSC